MLDFWRRMTKRMEKIAAVTVRDVNLKSGVVPSIHYYTYFLLNVQISINK